MRARSIHAPNPRGPLDRTLHELPTPDKPPASHTRRHPGLTARRPDRQPSRMSDKELPVTGYLDRFSRRPGESFTAFVSVRDGGTYRTRLVRVLSGDPNPNGPGMRFEDLSHRFEQSQPGRRQPIVLGSHGIVRS